MSAPSWWFRWSCGLSQRRKLDRTGVTVLGRTSKSLFCPIGKSRNQAKCWSEKILEATSGKSVLSRVSSKRWRASLWEPELMGEEERKDRWVRVQAETGLPRLPAHPVPSSSACSLAVAVVVFVCVMFHPLRVELKVDLESTFTPQWKDTL